MPGGVVFARDVPPLLAGARVFIAGHQGGSKGMPDGLKAWLRALGARRVLQFTDDREAPTHVLVQSMDYGHRPTFTAATAEAAARAWRGGPLEVVRRPVIGAPLVRGQLIVCESHAFLWSYQEAARAHLAAEEGRRRRELAFAPLLESVHFGGV